MEESEKIEDLFNKSIDIDREEKHTFIVVSRDGKRGIEITGIYKDSFPNKNCRGVSFVRFVPID